MKKTAVIMGIPIVVEVVDLFVTEEILTSIFDYLRRVDRIFSTYKDDSEITRFNTGALSAQQLSPMVKEVLQLAEDTKKETNGYFDMRKKGKIDPSGIVKGWAIYQAALLLKNRGYMNFLIDAGGDMQMSGTNGKGELWHIGMRNPFNIKEIIKVLKIENRGVATSGTYNRGQHIYNPHKEGKEIIDIVSLTVIGPTVYDADRFATAAFAMGKKGISFIQSLPNFEGYMIDAKGLATFTSGFERFVLGA